MLNGSAQLVELLFNQPSRKACGVHRFFGRVKGSGKDAVVYVLDRQWNNWSCGDVGGENVELPLMPRLPRKSQSGCG